MNQLELARYRADGLAKIAPFQHFLGDELVDAAHRLIGHEARKGPCRRHGFPLGNRIRLAAQGAVQPAQVGPFLVVLLDAALAEAGDERVLDGIEQHDVPHAVQFVHERAERQLDVRQDEEQHHFLARQRLLAGLVQPGTHAHHGGEGLRGLVLGGMEHGGEIAVGGLETRVAAVIAAEHVRGQRPHTLAAAAALAGFILSRVEVEQVLVRGRHHGLDGIGGRGLARAIGSREQVHRSQVELAVRHVAPIHENETLKEHRRAPRWRAPPRHCPLCRRRAASMASVLTKSTIIG